MTVGPVTISRMHNCLHQVLYENILFQGTLAHYFELLGGDLILRRIR